MRVTPRELRGIRAEGLVTRFAILGPIAFVSVELPAAGSRDTGIEKPTENAAWGIVLGGSIRLHGPREQVFERGTAFHVPAGSPAHWFSSDGRALIAGFAPMTRDVDTSDSGIRALGYEVLDVPHVPPPPPALIAPAGGGSLYRTRGSIETEVAPMGEWVFTRASYGPLSGYTSGWCDLPHWGMVLAGDLALRFESDVEILTAGDVYYCPAGAPGHQFQVADSATTIDYTPVADLFGPARKADWRATTARRLQKSDGIPARVARSVRGRNDPRPAGELALPPAPNLALPAIPPVREPVSALLATRRRPLRWVRRMALGRSSGGGRAG